jgi:nucleoside-diphosphate-sugar epimerase
MLVQHGYEAIQLVAETNKAHLLEKEATPHVRTIAKDILKLTDRNLRGIETVIHIPKQLQKQSSQAQLIPTHECHYRTSIHLAKTAKAAGVRRFIYLSSCSVYGFTSDDFVTEETPVHPTTEYAICQSAIERELQAIANDDFSPTLLRSTALFGASPHMRYDVMLNNLAGLAWTSKEIKLSNNGSSWCSLVHVLDMCQAILCSLEASRDIVHNQVFNVGDNNQNYQVKEVAEIVAEVFKDCKLSIDRTNSCSSKYRVSCKKITKLLPKFKCNWDARRGAEQLFGFLSLIEPHKNSKQPKLF